MNINSYKEFLSSISHVSRLNLQVWNCKGEVVFSSEADPSKDPSFEEIRDFSFQIMRQGTFQHTSTEGRNFLSGAPIKSGEEVIGSIIVDSPYFNNTSQHKTSQGAAIYDPKEMERFLNQISMITSENLTAQEEVEEMIKELEHCFEDLYLYSKTATEVKTLRFSDSALNDMVEKILKNMRSDLAFAELSSRRQYNMHVSTDKFSEKVSDRKVFVASLIAMIPPDVPSLKENYFIVNNTRETPAFMGLASEPYRYLVVKVQHENNFYGWLGLVSFNLKEIFRRGELRLLISIAEQIAMAITNSDLYQDLEQFVINTVKSLVHAIEAKDIYTRGHSERVSQYSMLIGEGLNLKEEEKKVLQWASILHDVGKIGIAENILNKPGRLDYDEYEIIKKHPQKGGNILSPVDQLSASLPGIIHHHERYDGNGYPEGLKGEEIPLLARIIAVADTFDAICSSRAYRSSRTMEEALEIVEKATGTQLDPHLVEVFREAYWKDLKIEKEDNYNK